MEGESATHKGMTTKHSIPPTVSVSDFLNWIENNAPETKIGGSRSIVATAVHAFLGGLPNGEQPPPLREFIANLRSYLERASTKDGTPLRPTTAANYMGKIRRAYRLFAKEGGRAVRTSSKISKSRAELIATIRATRPPMGPRSRKASLPAPIPIPMGDGGPFGKVSRSLIEEGARILSVLKECPTYGPRLLPAFDRLFGE